MANIKISELTPITGANTAADDEFVIVDTSATETKKITRAELATALGAGAVDSVNGQTGTVVLDAADVGALALTGGTVTGDVSFGDNDKAIFGASSDLQIYHQSSNGNSIIKEQGGGILSLQSNGSEISFYDTANSANMARFVTGGAVQLYHNGSTKFSTTASGINVTGNVVSEVEINAQTGTTYTTVLADQSKLVTLTNASAITLTIPANSSVAYPVGTKIDFAQLGAGQVTVAGAGGVTVNATPTLKLRDQYSGASCIKTATDTWLLVGDLSGS